MKIAVIVDRMNVSFWQAEALAQLKNCDDLIIYNCTNSRPSQKKIRNAFYYVLNLFTIRNRYTRSVPVSSQPLPISKQFDFECGYDGNWQVLPRFLLDEIARDRPDAILKFGLSLLRIPPELTSPILSYHHGDPDQFRGRPAGFYELLQGRSVMGQIVQILSNKLDAGAVVAFGESKVHAHSYRATLIEAYRKSPLLLPTAIANAVAGRALPKPCNGRAYRLPSNFTVVRFCLKMAWAFVRRIAYGALFEKAWQVSTAPADVGDLLHPEGPRLPPPSAWTSLPRPRQYSFLADPFFAPDGSGYLVEALHRGSGKGELLRIAGGEARSLTDPTRHFSYPGSIPIDGRHYVLPEIATWSPPKLFEICDSGLREAGELDIPGRPRLLDPTLFERDGIFFLFANIAAEGAGVLRLWISRSLHAGFEEHPSSPIRISPAGARMAGEIARHDEELVRLGQRFETGYGDGLIIFRIDELDSQSYRETEVGVLNFASAKGPHTLNFRGGTALFDWYRDRFSPSAGVRRLRGRLQR